MNTTKDDQLVEVYLENNLRVTDCTVYWMYWMYWVLFHHWPSSRFSVCIICSRLCGLSCVDSCFVVSVAANCATASRQTRLPQRRSVSARARTTIFQVDAFVQGFREIERKMGHGSVCLGLVLTTCSRMTDAEQCGVETRIVVEWCVSLLQKIPFVLNVFHQSALNLLSATRVGNF